MSSFALRISVMLDSCTLDEVGRLSRSDWEVLGWITLALALLHLIV